MINQELFNMLINPLRASYGLSWHRDDVKATATAAEEEEALKIEHYGIQWNAALYDDDCLSAVPASHKRVRTPEEREANISGGPMPGGIPVALKAGETVFYNNNIRESAPSQATERYLTPQSMWASTKRTSSDERFMGVMAVRLTVTGHERPISYSTIYHTPAIPLSGTCYRMN